jgi:hypothetical protein
MLCHLNEIRFFFNSEFNYTYCISKSIIIKIFKQKLFVVILFLKILNLLLKSVDFLIISLVTLSLDF